MSSNSNLNSSHLLILIVQIWTTFSVQHGSSQRGQYDADSATAATRHTGSIWEHATNNSESTTGHGEHAKHPTESSQLSAAETSKPTVKRSRPALGRASRDCIAGTLSVARWVLNHAWGVSYNLPLVIFLDFLVLDLCNWSCSLSIVQLVA